MIYSELVERLLADFKAHNIMCTNEQARMYVLLALILGENVTTEDIHDAWAMHIISVHPDHKCLVPFKNIPDNENEIVKDEPFVQAIRRLSGFIDKNFK